MTENLKFTVTKNGLSVDNDIKYLSVTNGIYDINIFYYGDYNADRESGNISIANTMVACKSDGLRPEPKYINGLIYVVIPRGELFYVHHIEEYKQWLDEAKSSAIALVEILKEYGFKAGLQPTK